VVANPCSYEYVKYRTVYSLSQIADAFCRDDVFWIHPVPRSYDDPLRAQIREKLNFYQAPSSDMASAHSPAGLVLSLPILRAMKRVQGWLEER